MRLIPCTRRSEVPSRVWPEQGRFFEDFFDSFFGSTLAPASGSWTPAVDVLEKDGNLILRAEMPGLDEKEIELNIQGNVLTLKGEKKFDKEEKREEFHRVERGYGVFTRSFSLPNTVDTEKIRAEYKNGVLTVTIPQKPEVRPREIPVNVH